MQSLFGVFTSIWFVYLYLVYSVYFLHMYMPMFRHLYRIVSNISNVKYRWDASCGFFRLNFEDFICMFMKVVYLICHWPASNYDVVQWRNISLI